MSSGFEVVGSELIHRGAIVDTEVLSVRTPEGDIVERQVIRHPGAVGIVAVHEGHVVLVRQYRAPIDSLLLEIPAGKLDVDGEPAAEAAHRELIEEVGLEPRELIQLGAFITATGFSDEELTLFAAVDCVEVPRQVDGVEEAHSEIVRVPVNDVMSWTLDGTLTDAKTLIGLFWARERGLLDS